ncbi:MAG TPA: tetratricopeptide repeat protein, partial [Terracidiphilus sp.]|nr:tetratricopeptide repeat protein [Terracidiphilus sp.]
HATRSPEPYWREALRRDPRDSRVNCALGRWHLRRGELAEAERLLRVSIARATERNPNPYDGEPYYNLGLVLLLQQRSAEAYEAFYKATWNAAWKSSAYHRLAEIDCGNSAWARALDHIDRSLSGNAENLNARNLKTMILSRLGRTEDARQFLAATRALDPLDIWSRFLAEGHVPQDGQLRLDLAFDLMRACMFDDAQHVLTAPREEANDGSGAMLLYALGLVCAQAGKDPECADAVRRAAAASPDYVFPGRLEEMLALQKAIRDVPQDARARYYLGNLLYDRRRHDEAIECWEAAAALDPHFATAWRNLGLGYFNVRHDAEKACRAFERARTLAPDDARILYEFDQLQKRTGIPPERRLLNLKAAQVLVEQRDDLTLEYATLCNLTGLPEEALNVLLQRKFQPWEGGEGLVLAEFTRAHLFLGQQALERGHLNDALGHFRACMQPPVNLGEAWHLLANRSQIEFWTGLACAAMGLHAEARAQWGRAARRNGDFVQMQVRSVSESTFWSGMALHRLGETEQARQTFQTMLDYSMLLEQETPHIDYFATSLPAMLLFQEDLAERQRILALFLRAQACLGLERRDEAWRLLREVEELDHNHFGPSELRAAAAVFSL